MITIALVASLILSAAEYGYAAPSVSLTISGPRDVQGVDNFSVKATISNTGDETLKLYKDPRSALSTFPGDTFSISSDTGAAPKFVGAYAKYSFEFANDFITLDPGTNTSITHDLGLGYEFSSEGEYKINASNVLHYQDASGEPQPIYPTISSKYSAKLSGKLQSSKRGKKLGRRAQFSNCSSTQQDSINTALEITMTYLDDAISYLNTHTNNNGPRYNTWFGPHNDTRVATVLDHYQKIKSSDPRQYTYDCDCDMEGVFAYVYPNNLAKVFLCPVFWLVDTSGTQSKAGTIVHEASHFTLNGGTRDLAYGHTSSQNLALFSPHLATTNADSHEFFAENTPALE